MPLKEEFTTVVDTTWYILDEMVDLKNLYINQVSKFNVPLLKSISWTRHLFLCHTSPATRLGLYSSASVSNSDASWNPMNPMNQETVKTKEASPLGEARG